jgi:hypothetical protein
MKLKIALLILLIASIVNAETFVKRFAYIMDCPYTAYDNSYLSNCKKSTAASSLFIFNYDNTSDVLWKTDKLVPILLYFYIKGTVRFPKNQIDGYAKNL